MKTVLITGGSSGIGLECVKKFHANKYNVINIDVTPPEIERGVFLQANLLNMDEISDVFSVIAQKFSIDVLVSNAGIHYSAKLEDTSEEAFDRVLSINFKSAFFVLKECIKLMKVRGGKVITIASEQVFIAKPQSAIYGATKAALAQLTKSIAIDYSKYNIIANCICAGTIETPLYWNALKKHSENSGVNIETIHRSENELQPIGRIGSTKDVASLAFYLANEAGNFIQGAMIPIDGGYTAK